MMEGTDHGVSPEYKGDTHTQIESAKRECIRDEASRQEGFSPMNQIEYGRTTEKWST